MVQVRSIAHAIWEQVYSLLAYSRNNDVGFFSPNLTAVIRLLHNSNVLPLYKDDKLEESRREALDTVISSIETCIINLGQMCDTIDDYYTETDFYWERLFYPDNDSE